MQAIEDYGFIADTHSGGLVSSGGSIDWLCLPRFDAGSCFAAILDREKGGFWRICPREPVRSVTRRYRDDTMILETEFVTDSGRVQLTDCLALEDEPSHDDPAEIVVHEVVIRSVRGLEGAVPMRMEFVPRFEYGYVVPWFRRRDEAVEAVGGPDCLALSAAVPVDMGRHRVTAEFEVAAGARSDFVATYRPSYLPPAILSFREAGELVERSERFWRRWANHLGYDGPGRDHVRRSLLILKSLIYSPTGGLVAAPTTSLPESLGGVRNWDYRYGWLRDSTFTLDALIEQNCVREAEAWVRWLLRAVAGEPEEMQVMYGVRGERRLHEQELSWLGGYEGSTPVRIGNGAVTQLQLDVYGEVMDTAHSARRAGIELPPEMWTVQKDIVEFVCAHWQDPDEGIWEVRSGREHFVHSKVMAWVALDRAVKAVEQFGREGDLPRWRQLRAEIRRHVLERGFNEELGHFVRSYGSREVDASLLMLPLVGFLPATDERVRRTVEAVQDQLMSGGLVMRYRTTEAADGLPAGEGSFLMCSFWLVDCLVLMGRRREAQELFDRLLGYSNDLGLYAEQYDTGRDRMLGNFPQAFSHVALVNAAMVLRDAGRARAVPRGG